MTNDDSAIKGFAPHCVDMLRQAAKLDSQRDFIARGSNAARCPQCLMAAFACFCHSRHPSNTSVRFTLLYHYTEIHKPTNSGRLIADLFPHQTDAFLWSRTAPDAALIDRITKYQSRSIILYPSTERRQQNNSHITQMPLHGDAPLHVIVLDATWRLASKMLHQSRWLDPIPTFAINEATQKTFMARHAKHDHQFATAEVAAMLLAQHGEQQQSQQLADYYETFNSHSIWSRRRNKQVINTTPTSIT